MRLPEGRCRRQGTGKHEDVNRPGKPPRVRHAGHHLDWQQIRRLDEDGSGVAPNRQVLFFERHAVYLLRAP